MRKRMIAWLLCLCVTLTAAPELLLASVPAESVTAEQTTELAETELVETEMIQTESTQTEIPEGTEATEESTETEVTEAVETEETTGTEEGTETEVTEEVETEVTEAAEIEVTEDPEKEDTEEQETEYTETEEIETETETEEPDLTDNEQQQIQSEIEMEVSALYAASGNSADITEEQLCLLAPTYLNNEAYDNIIAKCGDMSLEAINSVSETDEAVASYMYSLKTGSSILWSEFWAKCNLGDSTYETFEKQAAREVVYEYLQANQNLTKIAKKIEKNLDFVNVGYDLKKDVDKEKYRKELVANNKNKVLSDEKIKEMVDGLYDNLDTFMKFTEDANELFLMVSGMIEIQEIEIQAIDDLMVIHEQVKDPSIYNELIALRNEIVESPAQYMVENYLSDKALGILQKEAKKAVGTVVAGAFDYSALPWGIADKAVGVIATVYERYKPSVSDIVYSSLLYQYWMDSNRAVSHYQHLFYTGNGTEDDIRYLETAVNFNAACTKMLLSKSKNLVKNKDKRLYSKMDCWESSMGSEVNYERYCNSCLSNASAAIKNGTLVINQDSATIKDENGTVIDENYDSTESIKAKFAAIQNQYKPNVGQTWTGDWGGAIQCFGFARMVFYQLFGYNMPNRYVGGAKYKYQSEENVNLVGQISGSTVTVSSIKNLLQQGKLGDVIQACGAGNGGQHTMIFVSADDNGVTVYDCNAKLSASEPACVIHQWTIKWSDWASYYGTSDSSSENGISLYRAANYAQIYGDGDGMFYDDSVNFVIEDGVLKKYNGWQNFVEIPDSVTAIGDEAFKNNTSMVSVNIPDSVKSIGNSAFDGCTSLLGVVIPDSVESIGSYAFYNCSKMASVYLPVNEKFTEIRAKTFYECTALITITVPDTVTTIQSNAFENCKNLSNISLGDGLTKINSGAFSNCTNLEEIMIPDNVVMIAEYAFKNDSKLQKIKLPKQLSDIGTEAFGNCIKLNNIEIPRELDTAHTYLDYWRGSGPFAGCSGLKNVSFETGVTEITCHLFEGCDGLENIEIPNTVTVIEAGAFYGCSNLVNVKIPDSVTEIRSSAFQQCVKLERIFLPDSIIKVGEYAFRQCSVLSNISMSNNVEDIGTEAFAECTALTEIKIPKSLSTTHTYLDYWRGSGPFAGCENLKNVTFENGVTEIACHLFEGCNGIEKITIPDTVEVIENGAFYDCSNLKEIKIGKGVTSIENTAFYGCTSLTKVTIPDTVTSMGTSVFSGCTSLTEVHLPNVRENITDSTFYNCKKLTTVNFPSTLKAIRQNAFYGCESLTQAVIPTGLETIENSAFYGCKSLKKVVTPDTITSIGSSAFYGCEALTDVTLGSGLKAINSQTFYGCTVLPSIVIPYNVASIGDSAFVNCTKLTSVTVPRKTTSIASNAFSYPKKMTMYGPSGCYAQDYAAQKGIKFVKQDIHATSVKLNITNKTVDRYEDFQLTATIAPNNFTDEIVWTSSNEDVATVSENGYVETYEGGTAVITVTVGGKKASCNVTVRQLVNWMDFEEYEVSLKAGQTHQLSLEISPSNATDKRVDYVSSNPSVATVSASGLVTAKAKGETKITATAKDGSGEYAYCYVTVTGSVKPSGISLDQTSAKVKKGKNLTLKATVTPGNATNKKVTWKSSNTKIATVDAKGVVTAKAPGKVTITATAAGNTSCKATCSITVPYNIVYKLDKGKNNSKNPDSYYNQKITLKNPSRKGYEFKGWYTDSKFKNKITTISKNSKKNYTLYAKWAKVKVGKATLSSAKNNKSKQILVKYKKVSGAKGYEISYSTDKNFKKGVTAKTTDKTSYTIKKLKAKKTYYVRVRAYKVDSAGKKVYGKYSSVKKVKISKQ